MLSVLCPSNLFLSAACRYQKEMVAYKAKKAAEESEEEEEEGSEEESD